MVVDGCQLYLGIISFFYDAAPDPILIICHFYKKPRPTGGTCVGVFLLKITKYLRTFVPSYLRTFVIGRRPERKLKGIGLEKKMD